MRISTMQIVRQGTLDIQEQTARLANTQHQLSSGQRLLSPSDDPAAARRILDLNQSISQTEQFIRNADSIEGRLELEDSVLEGVGNLLQRVRELGIQGNNAALNQGNREALATEVDQRLQELLGLANSRDANNEFLFAGFQSNTKPFTQSGGNFSYNGDQGNRSVNIAPSVSVQVGDSGAAVFQAIPNGNGAFVVRDDATNNTGSGIIDPGLVFDPAARTNDTYTITLGAAIDSGVAIPGAMFNDDPTTADTLDYSLDINGVNIYSNITAPPADLNAVATAINGASVPGVSAEVNNGVLFLVNATPSPGTITVSETMAGYSDAADSVTGLFGSTLSGAAPGISDTASITLNPDNPASTYTITSPSLGSVSAFYTSGDAIRFDGIETNISGSPSLGDTFSVEPSTSQDIFSTVQDLINALRPPTGDGAPLNNAVNRFLSDMNQYENVLNQTRAGVGARLNAIENERVTNEEFLFRVQETRSKIADLDYAEAITRMNSEILALQAAQQSFVQVQGLSLFNFL